MHFPISLSFYKFDNIQLYYLKISHPTYYHLTDTRAAEVLQDLILLPGSSAMFRFYSWKFVWLI